jgi:TolB-like protein
MIVRSICPALVAAMTTWSGLAWSQSAQSAKAGPSEGDAVAVLPLEVVGNVPAGKPALEAAVVRGLTMFTGTTVEATQTSARLIAAGVKLPCEDAACWTAVGKAVGTRHLVAGRVERKGPNFEVQFRLLDGPSGRVLATEGNKCEAADCSVAELTRQTVRELARTMLSGAAGGGRGPTPAGTSSASASTAAPAGGAELDSAPPAIPLGSPPAVAAESQPAADTGPSRTRRLLPYLAIAAGAGAVGVGGWLIWRDGSCHDYSDKAMDCADYRDTMWEGVTATGVGAALLATGVVVALSDRADARNRTMVLIGPNSLLLRGRF